MDKLLQGVLITVIILGSGYLAYSFIAPEVNIDKESSPDKSAFRNISSAIFNECRKIEEYQHEGWYQDFTEQVEGLDFYTIADAEKVFELNKQFISLQNIIDDKGRNNVSDISEACLSNNGYVLAMIPGIYGGTGFKLIRYDINAQSIELAKREDIDGGKNTPWYISTNESFMENAPEQSKDVYMWFGPPYRFGQMNGEAIELIGGWGDAGCQVESSYSYSLENNYINIARSCSLCEGYEGSIEDYCGEY